MNQGQNGGADRLKQVGVGKLKLLQNRLGWVRQRAAFKVHSNPERVAIDLSGTVLKRAAELIGTHCPGSWRVMRKAYGEAAADEKKQHSQDGQSLIYASHNRFV